MMRESPRGSVIARHPGHGRAAQPPASPRPGEDGLQSTSPQACPHHLRRCPALDGRTVRLEDYIPGQGPSFCSFWGTCDRTGLEGVTFRQTR